MNVCIKKVCCTVHQGYEQKQIEKKKLAFLKTRSKIKKRKVPVFTQKIRENFLFLKSSFCTIEKVNYTLQSFDFRSNLTSTKKTIQNTTLDNSYQAHPFGMRQNQTPPNTGSKIKLLTSKKKEFILFEVWTDGSLHPQTAILNAINELLFEIFPYSLQVSKYEKVQSITSHKRRSLKRREVTDLSRKHFREKFLNLEIGNFYFDLETYLFLKKIKIYRIIDFINFFSSKKRDQRPKIIEKKKNKILDKNLDNLDLLRDLQSIELQYTDKIKMTLNRFQIFIHSVLATDPVIQSSSPKSKG